VTAVKVTFIDHQGNKKLVDAETGTSLMQVAKDNCIDEISADCGGACACATCQVYVDAAWLGKTGEASEGEKAMLEFTNNLRSNSRLSCQIIVTQGLDGLVVTTPEVQT
jgi:ferredoxin, 2Fe-2S